MKHKNVNVCNSHMKLNVTELRAEWQRNVDDPTALSMNDL